MKKAVSILILFIICLLPAHAQKFKDAIYLQNGSIIYGRLLEMTDNQYKIRTSDGSLIVCPAGDVVKFVKESASFGGRKEEGALFALEAGVLMGAQNTDYFAPFSFNLLVGYTINKMNSISGGSGVEFLGVPFSPLYLEYRRLLTDKKASPYIFTRAGKMMHVGSGTDESSNDIYSRKNYKGGFTFTLGTGISWSKEDIEPYLSFAYRYAATSYVQRDYQGHDATYKNSYNRLEVKFGFKF